MSSATVLLGPVANLSILVAVLYRVLNKPVSSHIKSRSKLLRAEMEELETAGISIRARLGELETRIREFEGYAQGLRGTTMELARQSAMEIGQRAEQETSRLERDAKAALSETVREQVLKIRKDTVESILGQIEKKLRSQEPVNLGQQFEKDFESGFARLA